MQEAVEQRAQQAREAMELKARMSEEIAQLKQDAIDQVAAAEKVKCFHCLVAEHRVRKRMVAPPLRICTPVPGLH